MMKRMLTLLLAALLLAVCVPAALGEESGEYYVYQNDRVDAVYHGTGDLFSSACVGEIMKGRDWRDAMRIAADYTARTIEVTLESADKPWYGVDFEATLPELIAMK